MRKIIGLSLMFLINFSFSFFVFAEIVVLKSGQVIEGKRIEQTDDIKSIGGKLISISKNPNVKEKRPTEVAIDNAAVYYLEAIDSLVYPQEEESKEKITQKIKKVIEDGWHQDLENFIKNNQKSLEKIAKARHLINCDFHYREQYEYLVEKELFPNEAFDLLRLLLVNSRYHQYQQNWNQAIDSILGGLTLAYHISQDDNTIGYIVSLKFSEWVYSLIEEYLNNFSIDNTKLAKISGYLRVHRERHFAPEAIVESEKKFFISTMKMLADGLKEEAFKKYPDSPVMRDRAKNFADESMNQADRLTNKYYGYFEKAARTNKNKDWQRAKNAIESLPDEVPEVPVMSPDEILSSLARGKYDEEYAKKVIRPLLAAGIGDFKKLVELYYKTTDELNQLLALLEQRE